MNPSLAIPEAGMEPAPGYCLSQRLGRGGYGEVWKAYAPGGFQVALKFVPLAKSCGATELKALEIIRDIRHPNLLVTFASWQTEEWLIIGMELADKTLLDRFKEVNAQGMPGIPRDELLDYFQEAARGIDFLNEPRRLADGVERFAIQHRDIKPQNILLVGNGVKVADFGLARLMKHAETGHSGGMTPNYAAPEFFMGQTSASSDQYCFAVTYCKVRGGELPFAGSHAEVMAGHLSRPPNLRMIPKAEEPIVARALAKEPKDRWPSCRAFVDALLACDNVPVVKDQVTTRTVAAGNNPATKSDARTPPPPEEAPSDFGALPPVPGPSLPPRRDPSLVLGTTLRSWLIGRDPECELVALQDAVSGRHCRLTETVDGFFLEDLKSSNGTRVNGHRISSPVHVLPSDQITLGQSVPMPWPMLSPAASDAQVIHIGRDPENDVVLDHPAVSGRHARIVVRSGVATIEDLGSRNGIAVGEPNSKVDSAILKSVDVVYFGSLPVPVSQLLHAKPMQSGETRSVTFRGRPIVFGRDPGCDMVLEFSMISSRHARLWQEGERVLIEDLGSTNGTFVNGNPIQRPTTVKQGDIIGLGSYSLKLDIRFP
jgi:pSer/pThr/pTyr-binding forkhead associated (FHA) protein